MNTIDYYNQNAEQFYQSTINVDMTDLYQPFLEMVPNAGHILDAGCGSGRDSFYFIQKGYQVTGFDASQAMVELSSKLINQAVLKLSFQEMDFVNLFDGIWACASLLHTKKDEIAGVFSKMEKALKYNGVLYSSFKYGDQEHEKHGRFFNSYNETSFRKIFEKVSNLQIIKVWQSQDNRSDRRNEIWLNTILQKYKTDALNKKLILK